MEEKQNKFGNNKNIVYICTTKNGCNPIWNDESVAQQVEHNTFNVGVPGSSPGGFTEKRQLFRLSFFVNRCVIHPLNPPPVRGTYTMRRSKAFSFAYYIVLSIPQTGLEYYR